MSANQNIQAISAPAISASDKRGLLALGDRDHCQSVVVLMKRGVLHGPIQANGGPGAPRGAQAAIAELERDLNDGLRAMRDYKARAESDMATLSSAVNRALGDISALKVGAGASAPERPADPAYSASFTTFVRNGEGEPEIPAANRTGRLAQINASMSVGTPADGGYLAPVEWDRKIAAAQLPFSPMRRLATVVETGVNAYSTLWDAKGWGSGWVGVTAARPETTGTTLAPLVFGHGEIYAQPAVTQRLLDDAEIDVAAYLETEVGQEFARQEAVAFVVGNGTNKPSGFLTYAAGGVNAAAHPGGALSTIPAASASAVTPDELVDFFYGLAAPYRQNATWLMSSTTAASLTKLKDGNGAYIWREGLAAGQPATLLGRPVEIDENMPAIAAGALPIAFGDFRAGYVINDRIGVRVLRDPYTNKPFVMFYCTKRVGGGVRDPRAIRVMKMAAA